MSRNLTVKLLSITLLLSICMTGVTVVYAQENDAGWSLPVSIMQTRGNLASSSMALVSDQMGRVHLFFPHKPEDAIVDGIDYMVWDGAEWTEPVNVLINPDNSQAANVQGVIDDDGLIHLIWSGGNNRLYYASAPASQAGSARGWSQPVGIAAALPKSADIAVAADGSVWVAYADAAQGDLISILTLPTQGDNWISAGSLVAATADAFPGEIGLAMDEQLSLHMTWMTLERPDGWPPTAVIYARSVDQGANWETQLIAEGDYGQAGVVVPQQDNVHIFWSSTVGGDGTYHQWSRDGGQTWSPPQRFMDRGGFSGLPSFAVDSADRLHYVRGSSIYAMWDGSRLTPPLALTNDEVCLQGQISCGERAQLAITTGNLLHVVYETDFNQIWYTSKQLDTPTVTAPTPTPVTQTPDSGQEVDLQTEARTTGTGGSASAQQAPPFQLEQNPGSSPSSQTLALVLGILPAFLLVAGVVAVVAIRKTR